MASATTGDQEKQKEAEKHQNIAGQSNIAILDTSAMLAQMMEMMNKMDGIITRLEVLEARSRPVTPTPVPINPAQQATQQITLQATQTTQLATQQATPSTPEQQVFQAPEQEQEQEQEQGNAENIAEKPTASSSSTVNKSTLFTISRQGAMSKFRDPTACLSNALLFACQHTIFLALT